MERTAADYLCDWSSGVVAIPGLDATEVAVAVYRQIETSAESEDDRRTARDRADSLILSAVNHQLTTDNRSLTIGALRIAPGTSTEIEL